MRKFLLAVVVGVALSAQPAFGANSTTFADPAGDGRGGPDITSVVVTNDDAGAITLRANVANMPTLAADATFFVIFDTTPSGGDPEFGGADYFFILDGQSRSYTFERWNGSAWEDVPTQQQVAYENGLTLTFTRADIGNVSTFSFETLGAQGPPEQGRADFAPDDGRWNYEIRLRPTLEQVRGCFQPAAPRAGRTFRAAACQVRLGTGEMVTPQSYRCRATLGGRRVRGTGRGGCTFRLPASARGKRLSVVLTVTHQGTTETFAPYTFRVR